MVGYWVFGLPLGWAFATWGGWGAPGVWLGYFVVLLAVAAILTARFLARTGEAVSRRIGKPPLLGTGQLTFLQWQARADNTKAREELGIEFTPWRDAVRRTAEWVVQSGRV